MGFIEKIYEKAKADKKTIAVPESTNEVMLKASAKFMQTASARSCQSETQHQLRKEQLEVGADITGIRIVNPLDEKYKTMLLDKYEVSPKK